MSRTYAAHALHLLGRDPRDVGHRRPVEGDAAVAPRQPALHEPRDARARSGRARHAQSLAVLVASSTRKPLPSHRAERAAAVVGEAAGAHLQGRQWIASVAGAVPDHEP